MGALKTFELDMVSLQNVSFRVEGFDPVLTHVDFELPLDQNIHVQSSNPFHAVHFLQILAGLQKPSSGCVMWNEKDIYNDESTDLNPHQFVSCYFESQRPHPTKKIFTILQESGLSEKRIHEVLEQFNLDQYAKTAFKAVSYEIQKTIQLIAVISKDPQMLILEDPALGLSESAFLEILDLIQYGQRRGGLRHVYFTSHHPTALRHIDATTLHIEDGLLYLEEKLDTRKIYNF